MRDWPRLVSCLTMSAVSSSYEARTWKASRRNGVRSDMAPVKGARNGMRADDAMGNATRLVGVPT